LLQGLGQDAPGEPLGARGPVEPSAVVVVGLGFPAAQPGFEQRDGGVGCLVEDASPDEADAEGLRLDEDGIQPINERAAEFVNPRPWSAGWRWAWSHHIV
jgi:hypothetical protein